MLKALNGAEVALVRKFGFALRDASEEPAYDVLRESRKELDEYQKKQGFKPTPRLFQDFQEPHPGVNF
jgi:hypothetical protein